MLSIGLLFIICGCAFLICGYCLSGIVTNIFLIASAIISTIGLIIIIISFLKGRKHSK